MAEMMLPKLSTKPRRDNRLRVLLVPDFAYWVTGTIARRIARHNPWIDATIVSGVVLRRFLQYYGHWPAPIDVLHVLTPLEATAVFPYFAGRVPCVSTIHHIEGDYSIAPAWQSDAIMTVCHQWHNGLIDFGVPADKLHMLPNGVDIEAFRPATPDERGAIRQKLGIPADALVIGFSAKRTSDSKGRKGIETLVAALKDLRAAVPNAAAVIIGPGWGDLVEEQRRAGLPVAWLPFTPKHEDLAEVYRSLDLYWVTARIEGGPVPLLEAMASGVCGVTTPVGAAIDLVVDGENALMVPMDDPAAVVRQTLRVANEPALRAAIAKAGRETIETKRQWGQTMTGAAKLYRSAVRNFRLRPGAPATNADVYCDLRMGGPNEGPPADLLIMSEDVPWWARSWIESREHLAFAKELAVGGDAEMATELARRAVQARPYDPDVLSMAAPLLPHPRLTIAAATSARAARAVTRRLKRITHVAS